MKEMILGVLSVGMVSCYFTSAFYCVVNLWFNYSVIHPDLRKAFISYSVAVVSMFFCGINWIENADYMKVPLWQALGWGVIHVSMPLGYYYVNNFICKQSSIFKCDAIRNMVLSDLTLQGYVGRATA